MCRRGRKQTRQTVVYENSTTADHPHPVLLQKFHPFSFQENHSEKMGDSHSAKPRSKRVSNAILQRTTHFTYPSNELVVHP